MAVRNAEKWFDAFLLVLLRAKLRRPVGLTDSQPLRD